jgi:hypothetical protein
LENDPLIHYPATYRKFGLLVNYLPVYDRIVLIGMGSGFWADRANNPNKLVI